MKDNRGFSLIEMLVVIAILSVLAGAGVQVFGLVQNGRVKKSTSTLETIAQQTQKNSENINAEKYWQLAIKNDGGVYKVESLKVDTKTVTLSGVEYDDYPDVYVEDSQKMDGEVEVSFTCGDAHNNTLITDGKTLLITFHKGTGEIDRVEFDNSAETDKYEDERTDVYPSGLGSWAEEKEHITIEVRNPNGKNKKTVSLYFNTGKVICK